MLSRVRALASSPSVALDLLAAWTAAPSCSDARRQRPGRTTPPGCRIACELAHRLAVLRDRRRARSVAVLGAVARCPARRDRMLAASRLTSHSHGPGQRLVEVVDVEHQPPLGRREHPEVRQVRVAAALHLEARARRRREVGGHHQRGARGRTRTARRASGRSGSAPARARASPPGARAARLDPRYATRDRTPRGSERGERARAALPVATRSAIVERLEAGGRVLMTAALHSAPASADQDGCHNGRVCRVSPESMRLATVIDDHQQLLARVRGAPRRICGRSPTGCSARSARPTTRVQEAWLRLSRADTERGREPGRLADDGGRPGCASTCCARASRAARSRSTRTCPTRSSAPSSGERSRAGGAAGRLGRAGAAGRARHADPGRAARVRAARHVRGAVRRDRADRRALARRPRGSSPAGPAAGCSGGAAAPDADLTRQREVVDAFFAAAAGRRLRRARRGARPRRGAARRSAAAPAGVVGADPRRRRGGRPGDHVRGALLPTRGPRWSTAWPASVVAPRGRAFSVMSFTVAGGRIVAIDVLVDPERLRRLDLSGSHG